MIWLTWRQHRKQALFTLVGLAVLAAIMVPTGLAVHHGFVRYGVADCLNKLGNALLIPPNRQTCEASYSQFNSQYTPLAIIGQLFIFIPLLVGLFWGAPLVSRELEHGTHRLVWTQGVSRRHWAAVKISMVGVFTVAVATAYGLGLAWWFEPWARTGEGRLGFGLFDVQGVVPIAYTLFAVALGIFAGTVWPKMLPAMAVTLVGFLGVRVLLTVLVRPNLIPAKVLTFPVEGATLQANMWRGDWDRSMGVRDAAGHLVAPNSMVVCPPQARDCATNMGVGPGAYNWLLYQPAERFWAFQGIESGIYAALAAALIYVAVRRIRRLA